MMNLGLVNPRLSYHQAYSLKTDDIEMYLENKDFETIIKDPNLFWLAYCKALFLNQNEKISECFSVSINGADIQCSGKKHIIEGTKRTIEKLRSFFEEGLENKKSFEILLMEKSYDVYFIKESSFEASKLNCGMESAYFINYYYDFIKPVLPKLSEFCGSFYIEDKKTLPSHYESMEVIRINWLKEHLVYPITPMVIPKQEAMNEEMYSLYEKKEFCDLQLISKDEVFHVHSIQLYLYGGIAFKKILTSSMKETINKTILFDDYSQDTVRAFIDFIYLGGIKFSEKIVSKGQNTLDLCELFEFACMYQIDNLINCCTNLISLGTLDDEFLESIKQLANLHNNDHLKRLVQHFSIKESALFIKV